MAGHEGPPDGTPERAPGGGDDEYRSIVFDEAFVKAARLEEYSASERVGDHAPAVRSRRPQRPGASRQALVLVLLIALAFGTAIYMGVRMPYRQPGAPAAAPLRSTVVPLTPDGPVPGGEPGELIAGSPAADFGTGADGIDLPDPDATRNFTEEQVVQALTASKDYLVTSAVDARTLTGGNVRDVRIQLDPQQHGQFDQSLARPADDGRHAATGWMVRFDPEHVRLADRKVRVDGAVTFSEVSDEELEVSADHVFVYVLRPAKASGGTPEAKASLFTVRRQVRIRFDHDDLRDRQLELAETALTAGPLACTADASAYLRPLLAGERDPRKTPHGTNPFATPGQLSGSLCGVLDTGQAAKVS
ncbi:hypothetical protein DMB38_09565 [Streptomyces sp. WAC 06738]|uniref:SCO2583 family membrane protein n=1 Tax=Streptomyces sp. WAC 06738 TaxID=2203210 RepID=UPI000F6D5B96|nr:hypothetical protein [Streptomyces sp. WAC 06738]AZM46032.1 hypothetical protein DMB38_09565 [Streptomyces sp. WAC 06738]